MVNGVDDSIHEKQKELDFKYVRKMEWKYVCHACQHFWIDKTFIISEKYKYFFDSGLGVMVKQSNRIPSIWRCPKCNSKYIEVTGRVMKFDII